MKKIDIDYSIELPNGHEQMAFWSKGSTPKYFVREGTGYWQEFNEQGLKRFLKVDGGVSRDDVDAIIRDIQRNHKVRFVQKIAGLNEGIYNPIKHGNSNNRYTNILNPEPLHFIEGKKGEWGIINGIIQEMFGHDENQVHALMGWLAWGRKAIRDNVPRPNSVLILVGHQKAGKTYFQENIIAPAFNGEFTNAANVLVKGNQFNKEQCEKCTWIIGDEALSKYTLSREAVTDKFKTVASTTNESFQPKGVDATTIHLNRFLTVSSNIDPRSLQSLPLLEKNSNDDKFNYILFAEKELNDVVPFDLKGNEFDKFDAAVQKELPAFLYAVDSYVAPAELLDSRYMVASYHHPKVVELINSTEPFMQLIQYLQDDRVTNRWFKKETCWEHKVDVFHNLVHRASAEEIKQDLIDHIGPDFNDFNRAYCKQAGSMGTHLRKAADWFNKQGKSYIRGGSELHTKTGNMWEINHHISRNNKALTEEQYNKQYPDLLEEVI